MGKSRTIKIFCNACTHHLYTYRKGGNGALVKCFEHKILEDQTAGDCRCPQCGSTFCRHMRIKGMPAHKIVGGKVFVKR